jgi:hypothetical protein
MCGGSLVGRQSVEPLDSGERIGRRFLNNKVHAESEGQAQKQNGERGDAPPFSGKLAGIQRFCIFLAVGSVGCSGGL